MAECDNYYQCIARKHIILDSTRYICKMEINVTCSIQLACKIYKCLP